MDLSSKGIAVGKNFYLVFRQTKPDPYTPALSSDDGSPYSNRNWQYLYRWSKTDKSDGNFMIRALVDYEASVPDITSPEDRSFTNKRSITVKGTASPKPLSVLPITVKPPQKRKQMQTAISIPASHSLKMPIG